MRRRQGVLFIVVAVVLAASVRLLVAQQEEVKAGFADPVLGRWDLTVQGSDGPYPSWIDIQLRKETQLMGRIVGHFGSVRHMTQVSYADGDLRFTVPVQYEKNKSDITFTGRLSGDRLEGTTIGEDGKSLKWTGVRAPSLRPHPAPQWGAPIELFNKNDLGGWKPRSGSAGNCWSVTGGILRNKKPCTDLVSERTFGDFKVHAEFNVPAKGNSGIYLRGRYEAQIQDDFGNAPDPLRAGGIYGFLRPYENAATKPGEWQAYDITLIGQRITVVLNGRTVLDNEVIPGITGGALDSNEGAPGPLMLQGDHTEVQFRSVTVTPAQ
jgi:hypothetical protein